MHYASPFTLSIKQKYTPLISIVKHSESEFSKLESDNFKQFQQQMELINKNAVDENQLNRSSNKFRASVFFVILIVFGRANERIGRKKIENKMEKQLLS